VRSKNLIAVPYWISDRLRSLSTTDAKAGLSLLTDYSQMRKYFSVEDLASLLAAQECKPIAYLLAGNNNTLNHLHSSWWQSCDSFARNEMCHSVEPLSRSGEASADICTRLSAEYAECAMKYDLVDSKAKTDDFFEVIDLSEDTLVVILKAGSLDAVLQGDNKLKLYRSILKVSYVYQEVHEVSRTALFEEYMKCLSNSVTA
jgi:hypothetical protein